MTNPYSDPVKAMAERNDAVDAIRQQRDSYKQQRDAAVARAEMAERLRDALENVVQWNEDHDGEQPCPDMDECLLRKAVAEARAALAEWEAQRK
jgi:hypothetical protein